MQATNTLAAVRDDTEALVDSLQNTAGPSYNQPQVAVTGGGTSSTATEPARKRKWCANSAAANAASSNRSGQGAQQAAGLAAPNRKRSKQSPASHANPLFGTRLSQSQQLQRLVRKLWTALSQAGVLPGAKGQCAAGKVGKLEECLAFCVEDGRCGCGGACHEARAALDFPPQLPLISPHKVSLGGVMEDQLLLWVEEQHQQRLQPGFDTAADSWPTAEVQMLLDAWKVSLSCAAVCTRIGSAAHCHSTAAL